MRTEDTWKHYAISETFNVIPRYWNPEIPSSIKGLFPWAHDQEWDIVYILPTRPSQSIEETVFLLHQYWFPLNYMKRHFKSLQKGFKADYYVVQNLTWSGVYLRRTLSNDLLHKLLTLVPLTETLPELYDTTMATFLSYLYNALW